MDNSKLISGNDPIPVGIRILKCPWDVSGSLLFLCIKSAILHHTLCMRGPLPSLKSCNWFLMLVVVLLLLIMNLKCDISLRGILCRR